MLDLRLASPSGPLLVAVAFQSVVKRKSLRRYFPRKPSDFEGEFESSHADFETIKANS